MKKKKKNKSLLIALAVLVILVGAYGIVMGYNKKQDQTETESAAEEGTELLSMGQEDITKISIQGADGTMQFVKIDGTWESQEEPDLPLTQSYINNMAKTFAGLNAVRTILETTENLAEYGLESPEYQITAEDVNGNTSTLYLGARAATGDYYAYVDGLNGVYTISSVNAGYFKHGLYSMISTTDTFPSVGAESIVRVTVTDGDQVTEIRTLEDSNYDPSNLGVWYLTKPYEHEFVAGNASLSSSEKNNGLFDYLSSLAYSGIAVNHPTEEEMEKYGLRNSQKTLSMDYRVTVESTEEQTKETTEETAVQQEVEETFELKIGSLDDTGNYYYVMPSGGTKIFKMSNTTLDAIFSTEPSSYIYKYFSVVHIATVDSFEVISNGTVYQMDVKVEKTTDPDGKESTEYLYFYDGKELTGDTLDAASKLFSDLISIAAERISIEPGEVGKELDFGVVYYRNEAPEKFEVRFFEYNTSYYLANANGDGIYLVNKRDLEEYRTRIVESFEAIAKAANSTEQATEQEESDTVSAQ